MKIHNKLIKSTTVAEKADLWSNFIITILTRTGLHRWSSLDTPLGSIKMSPNGDALIDSTTWDKMKELFFESDVVDSGMFYSNTKTIKKLIIMRKSKEVSN